MYQIKLGTHGLIGISSQVHQFIKHSRVMTNGTLSPLYKRREPQHWDTEAHNDPLSDHLVHASSINRQ
jgi:hypothetical protein